MRRTAILNDELPIIYFGHQAWIWGLNKKVDRLRAVADGMIRLVGVKKAD